MNNKSLNTKFLPLLSAATVVSMTSSPLVAKEKPNIIVILADDMGYGDVEVNNKESKIPTPHLNKMAQSGVTFSDAHTTSSVSTPTRYALLTGRYNWRSTLKSGVLSGYSAPLIDDERATIASVLQRANYTTGCVGKWHLGWDWKFTTPPANINELSEKNKGEIDYNHPIVNGPTSRGFDYFYGFSGSLDMPPYVYVENDKVTALPDRKTVNTGKYSWWREGDTGADFDHDNCLPHLTDVAIDFVKREGAKDAPFFLYLPYPGPHTPILPTEEWQGKSGLNPYGDFVMMLDSEVGRLIKTLEEMGIDDNTLVVFTTDNGCSPAAKIEELVAKEHYPNGIYRGHKADLFEGGHRVPCIVQWPAGIDRPGVSHQTICQTDFFHTFASLAGLKINDNEGEDSFDITKALIDSQYDTPIRNATIHSSVTGEFAIRSGEWKLLASPSSGGWSTPQPGNKKALEGLPPMQLYNLTNDPSEQVNLYNDNPLKVKELLTLLRKQISDGRSTPGTPQNNDIEGAWNQIKIVLQDLSEL